MQKCDGNSVAALWEYQRRYPHRRQPYRRVFETVHRNLSETGNVMPYARAGHGRRNVRYEEDVLDIVHCNPSANTRHISPAT
jgi:hypothetical protein